MMEKQEEEIKKILSVFAHENPLSISYVDNKSNGKMERKWHKSFEYWEWKREDVEMGKYPWCSFLTYK